MLIFGILANYSGESLLNDLDIRCICHSKCMDYAMGVESMKIYAVLNF